MSNQRHRDSAARLCSLCPSRQLTIALDYDDTYTEDPAFWAAVVDVSRKFGHRFICVTARRKTFDNMKELRETLPHGVEAHFSYDEPKADYAKRHGIAVDIWIDDRPGWIVGVT
jgi:hypothetical protein